MSIRRPLYESIADIRIETTGRQVGAVAADVKAALAASAERDYKNGPLQK
jgi:hypothetical protein